MTRRAKGEGSIYQRCDAPSCPPTIEGPPDSKGKPTKIRPEHRCRGRWVGTIVYETDGTKRDRKVIYGKTKTEVILKRKDAEKKAPAKKGKVGKSHTVASWMNEWLTEIAAPDLKPQTVKSHRSKIDTYIVPLIGMHRLDRLEAKHIRRMYARMQMECPQQKKDPDTGEESCRHKPSHGLSESTTRQTHAILSRALKIAVQEKLITEAETSNVKAPGTKTNVRDRLTVAQGALALAAATKDPHVSRWYAALHMGLRQGEALGLPWALVDFEANTLRIARTLETSGKFGTPKSDAGNRTILMFPEFRAHLFVHHATYLNACKEAGREPDPMDCVWSQPNGKPIGHKSDYNRWVALLRKAEVPRVSLHSARQTAAARLEELGWQERVAAEFLGHSDVKQTFKYQRGHSVEAQRRAMGEIES